MFPSPLFFFHSVFSVREIDGVKKKKKLRQGNIIEYVEGRDDAIKQLFLFATCPRTEKVSSPERFYIFTYSKPSFLNGFYILCSG